MKLRLWIRHDFQEHLKYLEQKENSSLIVIDILKIILDENTPEYFLGREIAKLNSLKDSTEPAAIDALCLLGDMYSYGIGVHENKSYAFRLYHEAMNRKSILGQYKIACCYLRGDGRTLDKEKGKQLLESIRDKYILAAYYLADRNRMNAPLNIEKYFSEYFLAARYGFYNAQISLREMYQNDFTFDTDMKLAAGYALELILQNKKHDSYLLVSLGDQYTKKEYFDMDRAELLYQAFLNENKKKLEEEPPVLQHFEFSFKEIKRKTKFENLEEASAHYESAALSKQDGASYSTVGFMYHLGLGVPQDYRKASEYYKKSIKLGVLSCQEDLLHCFKKMIGKGLRFDEMHELNETIQSQSLETRIKIESRLCLAELHEKGAVDLENNLPLALTQFEKIANEPFDLNATVALRRVETELKKIAGLSVRKLSPILPLRDTLSTIQVIAPVALIIAQYAFKVEELTLDEVPILEEPKPRSSIFSSIFCMGRRH